MKKLMIYKTLVILALLVVTITAKAQKNQKHAAAKDSTVKDTTAMMKMAADLGLTRQKARELNTAMNYKRNELERIMKDPSIDVLHKQGYLKSIMLVRHHKLDSMLTPAQKALLMQHEAGAMKNADAARTAMLQRHEQEMNQVPHQRQRLTFTNDTAKKKKN